VRRSHPLFRVHTFLGTVLGIYFAVLGLTGSALVFRPEIERGLVPALSHPSAQGGRPLGQAWHALRRAYPGHAIGPVSFSQYPATAPGGPLRVRVKRGFEAFYVYLDARTGELLAEQHRTIVWLQNLHFTLFGERVGLLVNAGGAVLLMLMCITGAVIWWLRSTLGRDTRDRSRRVPWRTAQAVHRNVGAAAVVFVAIVASGGAVLAWSWYAEEAEVDTRWQASVATWSVDLDVLMARATTAVPGGIPRSFMLPFSPTQPFRLDAAVGENIIRVQLDQHSGEIVGMQPMPPLLLRTRVAGWLADAHYGRILGLPNRIAWVPLGLTLPVLFVTGASIWRAARRRPSSPRE
jgi:uncharacterized iron-regulated membrane protein